MSENKELVSLLEGQIKERSEYFERLQIELKNVDRQIVFLRGQLEGVNKCSSSCCKENTELFNNEEEQLQ